MTGVLDRGAAEAAAAFAVERALKRGAAAADAMYIFGVEHSLSLIDGEPEETVSGFSEAIGVRTIDSAGRQGAARVGSLGRERLEEAVEWSLANCRACEEDPYVALAPRWSPSEDDLGLSDPCIAGLDAEARLAFCREMWEEARGVDPRVISVRSASWGDGVQDVLYVSSAGSMMWYSGATAGCGVSVVMSSGDDMEMGGYGDESRLLSALSPRDTAREAVRRTAATLGGTPAPTGRYDLMLDPDTSASFIDAVGELFLASNIHKNRSLLKGRLGDRAASAAVTLVDDGTLRGGLGTAPFDGEGHPCSRTCIMKDGVVRSWLYNLKYARMDGVGSTGNASRSLSGTPDVGCSNLCLSPGELSPGEMIRRMEDGILVTELLGLHTINLVSGDFSLGVKGVRIRGGEAGAPVGGMTIAGNLMDLLRSVDLVGSDFKFSGSVGACSMVIRDVAAAGS